ncbi:MAG: hypothetical protein ACTSWQ_05030 [Candidatus Thorarchaeota archaeon]
MTIRENKRQKVAELRSMGWTYLRIAQELGISDHAARRFAKQILGEDYSDHFLCPVCGAGFRRNFNQRYCSYECRKHAQRLRKRFYKLVKGLAGMGGDN